MGSSSENCGNAPGATERAELVDLGLKFAVHRADIVCAMNNAVPTPSALHSNGMAVSDDEILTVTEVARFLRVPKSTVYKLARVGELPASKIGKHWRFLRRDLHQWLHSRPQQNS
jgi:excisionase family DNA binding protein